LEERLIVFRAEIISARIAESRHTEPVHFAEKFLRAFHLFIESWMRKFFKQRDGCVKSAAVFDRSRWISACVSLQFAWMRQIGFAIDAHGFESRWGHHFPIVVVLHVDGILRR